MPEKGSLAHILNDPDDLTYPQSGSSAYPYADVESEAGGGSIDPQPGSVNSHAHAESGAGGDSVDLHVGSVNSHAYTEGGAGGDSVDLHRRSAYSHAYTESGNASGSANPNSVIPKSASALALPSCNRCMLSNEECSTDPGSAKCVVCTRLKKPCIRRPTSQKTRDHQIKRAKQKKDRQQLRKDEWLRDHRARVDTQQASLAADSVAFSGYSNAGEGSSMGESA